MSTIEYERQNNARLDELASKVSALRGVTVDIYDSARDQRLLDANNDAFASLSTSLKSSAGRLRHMANNPRRVQVLRVAAIITGAILVLWFVWGFLS
ncbi:hypothetical protein BDZ91DRAFT_208967 [Kalaharituber pfeilii]|nr:hypothetical protein BDZ91DRAFT_208967 [Kalaharituber pfeilii]